MSLQDYLAIIPARTGSRRVPGKNFRKMCGKPLWLWAVECARRVGLRAHRIAVSTDHMEAQSQGTYEGDVEGWRLDDSQSFCWLRRPLALCTDEASTWWAVEHACYVIEHFGPVVLLQPTSPLRLPEDVLAAIELFEARGRRQGVATAGPNGHLNGAVYVCGWKWWEREPLDWLKHVMPAERSVDIDEPEDWSMADGLMRRRGKAK